MGAVARVARVGLVALLAASVVGCRAGDATGLGLQVVNESAQAVTFTIEGGPQAGQSSIDACRQLGFALQPEQSVTVEVRSATDTFTFTADPPRPAGAAPERWIVVRPDGTIDGDAPAGSPGTEACPSG